MASRPELVLMCKELEIECTNMNKDEMIDAIREEADKRFNHNILISADNLSKTLKAFLTNQYDYVIKDKDGKKLKF